MTKAKFLRQSALDDLRSKILDNLELYRSGEFTYLQADTAFYFEHDIDVHPEKLSSLKPPVVGEYFEAENCATLYAALENLSPYEARDERFWVLLSHTDLLAHTRARWPIPSDDEGAVRHISKHFFARDKRQIERDNVGSRLWWMARLCARVPDIDQKRALAAFLFRSDVRANLVERPTTSQSAELFGAVLKRLVESYDGKRTLFERSVFRKFMMEINSLGGYTLLDCLPASSVEAAVSDVIKERLAIEAL